MLPTPEIREDTIREEAALTVRTSRRILFDERWCKRCGICVAICPRDVFASAPDGLPIIERPEDCTGCLLCELQCPDFALEIVEEP